MTQFHDEDAAAATAPTPGFATSQVHAGEIVDPAFGARISPIYLTAGFQFDDFDQARDRFAGESDGFTYSRYGNPTNAAVERRIALLEKGDDAILVGSGQAAVTVALLALLKAGDHILSAASIYEGTRGLFRENFARFGIDVDFIENANDLDAWRAGIRPTTRVLYGESIPNPKNDLINIEGIAAVAHEHGLPFAIDNTLATPYLLRPIEFGADIVIHSASKFLAGHGAAIGGVLVATRTFDWTADATLFPHLNEPSTALGGRSYVDAFGRRAFIEYARSVIAGRLGPTISPFNAFLIQQGIETLSLRMARHSANALEVAEWLERQPEVASVDYSGLASSPHNDLARTYLPRGQGSVFSFTLTGGESDAARFIDAVALFSRMTHIGDVRSLILHPSTTTHNLRTPDELAAAGIDGGTIRLSIGIEEPEDLIADLGLGFAAVRADAPASADTHTDAPAPADTDPAEAPALADTPALADAAPGASGASADPDVPLTP